MTTANTQVKLTRVQEIIATWNRLGFKIHQIPFNPEWENETGYFNNAVKDYGINKEIPDEALIWSVDGHGRHLLIAPTIVGNVVVFDRYAHGQRDIVASNVPDALRKVMPSNDWSNDDLHHWFGCPPNLPGLWVEEFCKNMNVHLLRQSRTAEKANEQ